MNDSMLTNQRVCHQGLKEQILEKGSFFPERFPYLLILWLLIITDTFLHYVSLI